MSTPEKDLGTYKIRSNALYDKNLFSILNFLFIK